MHIVHVACISLTRYYATSSGKVFHGGLPPNFDYPQSWSDVPLQQDKCECAVPVVTPPGPPPGIFPVNMSCEFVTLPPGT